MYNTPKSVKLKSLLPLCSRVVFCDGLWIFRLTVVISTEQRVLKPHHHSPPSFPLCWEVVNSVERALEKAIIPKVLKSLFFSLFFFAVCFILLWFSQCLEFTGWVCLPLPSVMIQRQNNHRDIHSSPTSPSLPSVWKKIKEKKKPYGLRRKQFYNLNKL